MDDLTKHKADLTSRGVTKFEGLVLKPEARRARDLIHNIGAEHGLYTAAGWQRSDSRFGVDKTFRTALKALTHSDRFPNLITADVMQMAEDLLEKPVAPMSPGQQVLFTLPGTAAWSVPHDVWHVDLPRLGTPRPPGLQVFACLDDVEPQGGGTLVVAGSHRLQNTSRVLSSKELKQRLGQEAYFRSLFDATRAPISRLEDTAATVDDVDLDVTELTGEIGDMYLMDLRTLHTPAPNASSTARLMLTCRLLTAKAMTVWSGGDGN